MNVLGLAGEVDLTRNGFQRSLSQIENDRTRRSAGFNSLNDSSFNRTLRNPLQSIVNRPVMSLILQMAIGFILGNSLQEVLNGDVSVSGVESFNGLAK